MHINLQGKNSKQAGGAFPGFLAVVLLFALFAAAAYLVPERDRFLAALAELDTQHELQRVQHNEDLARLRETLSAMEAELAAAERQRREQQEALAALNDSQATARLGIPAGSGVQALPILTEAAGLFRLAHRYLAIPGGLADAEGLYESGIDLLLEVDDPAVDAVRTMMEEDLARMRATPRIDPQDLYLRLSRLVERAAALDLTPVPEDEEEPGLVPQAGESLFGRLLARLDDYLIVREIDQTAPRIPSAADIQGVGQAVSAALEQAKLALLRESALIYRQSIDTAIDLLDRYTANSADKREVLDSLRVLSETEIVTEPPVPGEGLTILQRLLSPARPGRTEGVTP